MIFLAPIAAGLVALVMVGLGTSGASLLTDATRRPPPPKRPTRTATPRLITIGTDPRARLCVADVTGDIRRVRFLLDGRFRVELPMPGLHHATNAAATFAVARWFGMAPPRILARLGSFEPPGGRPPGVRTWALRLTAWRRR